MQTHLVSLMIFFSRSIIKTPNYKLGDHIERRKDNPQWPLALINVLQAIIKQTQCTANSIGSHFRVLDVRTSKFMHQFTKRLQLLVDTSDGGPSKLTHCTFYDKSTKFGTDVDNSLTQYWKYLYHTSEHPYHIWCFYHKIHNWVQYWNLEPHYTGRTEVPHPDSPLCQS